MLVLNKTDLVDADALPALETRLRGMNALARIHRASHADLPVQRVLNLAAFDLERALERKPTFLEPEYPFEWTGAWDLASGATLDLGEGPDASMSLVMLPLPKDSDATHLRNGAERCVRLYAEPACDLDRGAVIVPGRHLRLSLAGAGRKRFALDIPTPGLWALYTQHRADELDLRVRDADGSPLAPVIDHAWSAQHQHDDSVTSVGIEVPGDLDPDRLNRWLSGLLREQGPDIFRMKGFLSLAGEAERFVFQGVHMLFNGRPHGPWGDAPRGNQLVFIGRNLDRAALEAGLRACLV